jgi:hypothetical protein
LHLQSRQIIRSQGDRRSRGPHRHRGRQQLRVCQTLHHTPQDGRRVQGIQILRGWQMPQDRDSQQQYNVKNNHQQSTGLKSWPTFNTSPMVGRATKVALFLCPAHGGSAWRPAGNMLDRTDKQATWSFGRRFAKLLACSGKGGWRRTRKDRQASNLSGAQGWTRKNKQASKHRTSSFISLCLLAWASAKREPFTRPRGLVGN